MGRRKTGLTELIEFFFQRTDRRFSFGKKTGDVILSWAGKNPDGTDILIKMPDGTIKKQPPNTKKLSLLRGLVLEYQAANLDELPKKLENSDDFYVKNVEGNCMCGEGFSLEAVILNIKGGNEAKNNIYGKIKAQKKIKISDCTAIGMDCYNGLPKLLDELYIPNNLQQSRDQVSKTKEEITDFVENISPQLMRKLGMMDLTIDNLKKLLTLAHAQKLLEGDESGINYDIDLRNNKSTFNWFKGLQESTIREGIDEDNAEDLLQIWHKINKTAHLLTDEDLAKLIIYSHEFRQRKTDLLLAGVKQDLLYLSSLDASHEYIKEYGPFNIDKHFVYPRTTYKYRHEKDIPKDKTIREILNQEFITRIELMGIHNHFPNIIETRISINRQVAQKYGLGRTWDYILKEIEPWFEKTKEELHEEYKEWGEIINEHVFTKDDYLTVKYFLKKTKIGQTTDRENYLRNHDIQSFEEVAPKIIKIGRKLRYARKIEERKKENKTEEGIDFEILKQEYFLKEDFVEKFPEFTKIEGITADKFFEILESTGFVEHKEYQKFRQKIIGAYEFGIVPKELIAKTSQEKTRALYYYKILQNQGVHEQSEKTQEKLKLIKERYDSGVIAKLGFAESLFKSKYIDTELEKQISAVYNSVAYIKVPDSWEKARKRINELNNIEFVIFDKRGVQVKSSKNIKKEIEGTIYYNAEEAVSLLAEKDKSIPMPKEIVEKFKEIINRDYYRYNFISVSPDKEQMTTQESINTINERYAKLEVEIKQQKAMSKLNSWTTTTLDMDYKDLEKLFTKMPKTKEFILSKHPDYSNDKKFFGDLKKASTYTAEDIDFILSFDPKNSTIPKIKQEKSLELSLIIRQELASQTKDEESWKKEIDRFYFDQIFPELQRDLAVRKIRQGLGMQKKTGERILKAYDSEKWESFKPEYLKYNLRRVLQGKNNLLDKAIRGEIAQYKMPEEMLARFEEDLKEKRFNESDALAFREAISKIEQIVNEKLINFYSIPYQLNMLQEEERAAFDKVGCNTYYGHKSSGRHYYHGRYHSHRRRY
ncbi:MAG: hypothetical protein QW666_00755 [Candidatus Woesearchaeota archaeon]